MCNARKDMMACNCDDLSCDSCLLDCKRAEITAKEKRITADLLAACEAFVEWDKSLSLASASRIAVGRQEAYSKAKAAIAKATA